MPEALSTVPALAMIRDRDSNLWIAAGAQGLLRVNSDGVTHARGRARQALRGKCHCRCSKIATATLGWDDDRDRAAARRRVHDAIRPLQGLPAGGVGAIHVDAAQRTWFAPTGGRAVLAARRIVGAHRVAGLNRRRGLFDHGCRRRGVGRHGNAAA